MDAQYYVTLVLTKIFMDGKEKYPEVIDLKVLLIELCLNLDVGESDFHLWLVFVSLDEVLLCEVKKGFKTHVVHLRS